MSSTEYCNQFYIETTVCVELRNRGYETLLISSQKESIALGEYSIPNIMFSSKYNENEKVLALNHYVRHLEMKHHPDIIVIGVPGAAMPYHYQYSSDFGILAYEFSEAIKPDFAILSSPCMSYDLDFFKSVEDGLHGRLGIFVDVHSLSPYALDFTGFSKEKCLAYLSLNDLYVQESIEQIKYNKLLNLNNINGVSSAVDRLIDKLSNNIGSLIT